SLPGTLRSQVPASFGAVELRWQTSPLMQVVWDAPAHAAPRSAPGFFWQMPFAFGSVLPLRVQTNPDMHCSLEAPPQLPPSDANEGVVGCGVVRSDDWELLWVSLSLLLFLLGSLGLESFLGGAGLLEEHPARATSATEERDPKIQSRAFCIVYTS